MGVPAPPLPTALHQVYPVNVPPSFLKHIQDVRGKKTLRMTWIGAIIGVILGLFIGAILFVDVSWFGFLALIVTVPVFVVRSRSQVTRLMRERWWTDITWVELDPIGVTFTTPSRRFTAPWIGLRPVTERIAPEYGMTNVVFQTGQVRTSGLMPTSVSSNAYVPLDVGRALLAYPSGVPWNLSEEQLRILAGGSPGTFPPLAFPGTRPSPPYS